MEEPPSPLQFSSEEIAWLRASEILDEPPVVPPKDSFRQSLTPTEITLVASRCSTDSDYPVASSSWLSVTCNSSTGPRNSARREWIYRQPKAPASGSSRISTGSSPRVPARPRPAMGYQSPTLSSLSRRVPSTESRRSHKPAAQSLDSADITTSSASAGPFWSTILRPRSRSERSMPLLRTIPSESQLSLARADQPETVGGAYEPCTPKKTISSPMAITRRPSSVSSRSNTPLSSSSPSPTSSRSESPITPISLSCSPYSDEPHNLARRRHTTSSRTTTNYHYRRHRATASVEGESSVSSSCPPPSKSILTRTASVSTKDSSLTVNKTVKFAAAPTVHYASSGYWDVEAVDEYDQSPLGINVESMDLDDDPFANYGSRHHHPPTQYKLNKPPAFVHRLDAAKVRELKSLTPTPERERDKANGLKRLVSINRRPSSTARVSASPGKPRFGSPPPSPTPSRSSVSTTRPQISVPYPLGAYPQPAMQSTASLRVASQHGHSLPRQKAGSSAVRSEVYTNDASTSDLLHHERGSVPLRSAPSMESFRSSKSAAVRSVRSLSGSVKTTASGRGLRAWFERTLGWTES